MGSEQQRPDSEQDGYQGVLFRTAARIALPIFGGVLILSLRQGGDPVEATLRALAVLLAVTGCGWLGERVLASPSSERPRD